MGIFRVFVGRSDKGKGFALDRWTSSRWRFESNVGDGTSCLPRRTKAEARDFTFAKKVGMAGVEKSRARSSRFRRGRAKSSSSSGSSTYDSRSAIQVFELGQDFGGAKFSNGMRSMSSAFDIKSLKSSIEKGEERGRAGGDWLMVVGEEENIRLKNICGD